jgi:ribosomal protein L34E
MSKCEKCRNCVVALKLVPRNRIYRQKFAEEWANLSLSYGKVRCKKGMWLKENMQEKTLLNLVTFRKSAKVGYLHHIHSCPDYEN